MKTLIDRCCARYLEIKTRVWDHHRRRQESVPMMERTIDGFRGFLDCPGRNLKNAAPFMAWCLEGGQRINDKPSMHEAYEMGKVSQNERILITAIQYIYATYHQLTLPSSSSTHHAVVPRLHGNTACLVRMDGENTIPAGPCWH